MPTFHFSVQQDPNAPDPSEPFVIRNESDGSYSYWPTLDDALMEIRENHPTPDAD
jgi:hypothetical protein